MTVNKNNVHQDIVIPIEWPSDNAHAMVLVKQYAKDWGFDITSQSMIATSVSELATNIIKYARKGSLFVCRITEEQRLGIEIRALDEGPGITDIPLALTEEYSTGGSLGLGFSGIQRMMDDFEIKSTPGKGTAVTIRKWRSTI